MKSIFFIIGYFVIVNLLGFALMGIDKRKAVRHAFRIPEATLFSVALVGGSIGSILGMFLFRHKTRHWYFKFTLPIILLIQIGIIAFLHFCPIEFSFM